MLAEFRVKGFKNFKDEISIKFDEPGKYDFNNEAIQNGIVNTALLYGPNGSGKTNLGYAIMDIRIHLTDHWWNEDEYKIYKNFEFGQDEPVEFYYKFVFSENIVEYRYEKNKPKELLNESLNVNGEEVITSDYIEGNHFSKLKGTETLNKDLQDADISFTKYILKNSLLENDDINDAFKRFNSFVDRMNMFGSVGHNAAGANELVGEGIIRSGNVEKFQFFLSKAANLEYKLIVRENIDSKELYCKFSDKEVPFFEIASRGTLSLAHFYYWLVLLEHASFIFADEFDAFYHYKLSYAVMEEFLSLKTTQTIATTHNTDLMTNDFLRPDCYYVIDNNKTVTFADATDKDLRSAHNLQKMYKAGAFNVR